ncbi:hypothetical protein, partial [Lagierella sp.]|uniref:InlB B-repeat-containing protein n=1 Tax=Lagierella sp. TaxID=2849657 RepID=UPI00260BCB2D
MPVNLFAAENQQKDSPIPFETIREGSKTKFKFKTADIKSARKVRSQEQGILAFNPTGSTTKFTATVKYDGLDQDLVRLPLEAKLIDESNGDEIATAKINSFGETINFVADKGFDDGIDIKGNSTTKEFSVEIVTPEGYTTRMEYIELKNESGDTLNFDIVISQTAVSMYTMTWNDEDSTNRPEVNVKYLQRTFPLPVNPEEGYYPFNRDLNGDSDTYYYKDEEFVFNTNSSNTTDPIENAERTIDQYTMDLDKFNATINGERKGLVDGKSSGKYYFTIDGDYKTPQDITLSEQLTVNFLDKAVAVDKNGNVQTGVTLPVTLDGNIKELLAYNDNFDGENTPVIEGESDQTSEVVVPKASTTDTKYEFKHWALEEEITPYDGTKPLTKNINLVPVFELATLPKVIVDSNIVGGTVTVNPEEATTDGVVEGTLVKVTANPKDGYKLEKTTITGPDGKEILPSYISKDFKMPAGDVKVTATFIEEENTITYKSFDKTMGTVKPTEEKVGKVTGKPVGSTAEPNEGYKFLNWRNIKNEVVSENVTFVPETNDTAIYIAYFEEKTITVNYKSSNEKEGTVTPATETVGVATGKLQGSTATAEEGYEFVNWTDESGEEV